MFKVASTLAGPFNGHETSRRLIGLGVEVGGGRGEGRVDSPVLREVMPEEVVGGELDGFLRRDQRQVHRRSLGGGGVAERESRSGGDELEVIAHSNGAERATCVSLSPLSPLKSRQFFSNEMFPAEIRKKKQKKNCKPIRLRKNTNRDFVCLFGSSCIVLLGAFYHLCWWSCNKISNKITIIIMLECFVFFFIHPRVQ